MYNRILVPLDGSRLAEQALPHAAIHAAKFEAEIRLLMVLSPLPEPSMGGRGMVLSAEEASARVAKDYLEGVAAELRQQGLQVQTEILEGKPYVRVVRYAEENGIDLIIMSTRGQSGLSRWLLGSVTDRVVRGATVPVLLVHCHADCDDN